MPNVLTVNEIFHSIQGESSRAGEPCTFIRLTGCNLRCVWCDTEYAFHEGKPMSVDEVMAEVERIGCSLVELTGGEPLLQKEAIPLMDRLVTEGYRVMLETGGSLSVADVPAGVKRIVDIKCPGSGEAERNLWENLEHLGADDELKFVIADREDYRWAAEQVRDRALAERCTVLFSPVQDGLEPGELADWILADGLTVKLQIQLHKLLWPGVLRGV
ncbi:7-carboxy-7-deazaguanine synthase [Acidobacteria bacterium Mor1]|nr:7-carboxy-7-deazaguanine synthase [Acidobacteria bacterium Mor1]